MLEFTYTVTDPMGIHARPAGMLAKEAGKYSSVCTLRKGEKSVRLTQLMALMSLSVKAGDAITITAEGGDEEAAIQGIRSFLEAHL